MRLGGSYYGIYACINKRDRLAEGALILLAMKSTRYNLMAAASQKIRHHLIKLFFVNADLPVSNTNIPIRL